MPVTGDNMIKLSRQVVSVEINGKLKDFIPNDAGRSLDMLNFGFCRMEVTVAWPLVTVPLHLLNEPAQFSCCDV